MRLSHRGRFVYVSIPKTGSESVRALLDPVSEEPVVRFPETTPERPFYSHMRPVELAAVLGARGIALGEDTGGYLCVATVRNPWERLASLWRMMRRDRAFGPCPPFDDWVAMLADGQAGALGQPGQKWYHHGILPQAVFLANAQGRLMTDHVWRIEDGLDPLRATLAARLPPGALPGPVPHVNRAPGATEWQRLYTHKTHDTVTQLYAADLAAFGYMSHPT